MNDEPLTCCRPFHSLNDFDFTLWFHKREISLSRRITTWEIYWRLIVMQSVFWRLSLTLIDLINPMNFEKGKRAHHEREDNVYTPTHFFEPLRGLNRRDTCWDRRLYNHNSRLRQRVQCLSLFTEFKINSARAERWNFSTYLPTKRLLLSILMLRISIQSISNHIPTNKRLHSNAHLFSQSISNPFPFEPKIILTSNASGK